MLKKAEFPRSAAYPDSWMIEQQMGPNAVWLCEWLLQAPAFVALASEARTADRPLRLLDLGCGKAMSSVFLARELGAQVFAVDLWVEPGKNRERIVAMGCDQQICALRAEAHDLPFAEGYFDALVSIDAYQYFGTDELYLAYVSRFVRPGGLIGVVVPGWTRPVDPRQPPPHLLAPQANGKVFWEDGCRSFKSAAFWRELWLGDAQVEAVEVDSLEQGWRHWADFERAIEAAGKGHFPSDAESIERDAGQTLAFHRLCARRTERCELSYYEPGLATKVGVD